MYKVIDYVLYQYWQVIFWNYILNLDDYEVQANIFPRLQKLGIVKFETFNYIPGDDYYKTYRKLTNAYIKHDLNFSIARSNSGNDSHFVILHCVCGPYTNSDYVVSLPVYDEDKSAQVVNAVYRSCLNVVNNYFAMMFMPEKEDDDKYLIEIMYVDKEVIEGGSQFEDSYSTDDWLFYITVDNTNAEVLIGDVWSFPKVFSFEDPNLFSGIAKYLDDILAAITFHREDIHDVLLHHCQITGKSLN